VRSVVTLTLDSSAAFELIGEPSPRADRLAEFVSGHDFAVPTLFRYELSNLIRRSVAHRAVTDEGGVRMFEVILAMPLREFDFDSVFARAWSLRGSYTFTDAAYIAVAEITQTPLVTLDERLARGPAVRCQVIVPPRG
jgi:predicted nucleic acid-binding protein